LLSAFNPNLPLEKSHTIPSSWYFDGEMFAAERQKIFARTWQVAGRTEQVANPGAFVTADIAGEPVLVVRDQDSVLRAFFNVCRHRAARVAPEEAGHASRLRCPYHGWTYDLTGKLRGTPEFEGVADFQREDNGLVPLEVETWGPLVCVRQCTQGIAPEFSTPLGAMLAPVASRMEKFGLGAFQWVERREYDLNCNWKVFVDNYLDGGYHVNYVHPGLAGVIDYSEYRTEIEGLTSSQISPLRGTKPGSEQTQVGDVRKGSEAVYSWIFPNFMINICEGVMDTNLVLPVAPDRCRVVFDFYFTETGPAAEKFIQESIGVSHQIQIEDQGICEDVQKGLASKSYSTGRFSVRREAPGYHFHRLLAQFLQ
jgi:phenylpropionate dioxygenase-like ring-hydroxylating dioxygenase large terminal subunit